MADYGTTPDVLSKKEVQNLKANTSVQESGKPGRVGDPLGTVNTLSGKFPGIKATRTLFDAAYPVGYLPPLLGHRDPTALANVEQGLWVLPVGPEPMVNLSLILAHSSGNPAAAAIARIWVAGQVDLVKTDGSIDTQWVGSYIGDLKFTAGTLGMYAGVTGDAASHLKLTSPAIAVWCSTAEVLDEDSVPLPGFSFWGNRAGCIGWARFPLINHTRLILAIGPFDDAPDFSAARPVTKPSL